MERRIMRDHSDPLALEDKTFKNLFRLTKVIVQYLLEQLGSYLGRNSVLVLTPQQRMFAALYFYSTGSYQRTIGQS